MTQEEINAFVESIAAAGVTVESLAAMHALKWSSFPPTASIQMRL